MNKIKNLKSEIAYLQEQGFGNQQIYEILVARQMKRTRQRDEDMKAELVSLKGKAVSLREAIADHPNPELLPTGKRHLRKTQREIEIIERKIFKGAVK